MRPEVLRARVRALDLGDGSVVREDKHGVAVVVRGDGAVAAVQDCNTFVPGEVGRVEDARDVCTAVCWGELLVLGLLGGMCVFRWAAGGGELIDVRGEGAFGIRDLPNPVRLSGGDDNLRVGVMVCSVG